MKDTKNILAITYWSFSDALIQTYTLPYLKIIAELLPLNSKIYLVTLEKENYNQTTPTNIPGIINIRFKYSVFGISASATWLKNILSLKKVIHTEKIDFIHAFCTPAGMIGYILSKLTRKPLVLDSYEPHAEAMVENGEWKKNSWSYKILFYFEKKQTKHASKIIGATSSMKDYALEKYKVSIESFFVKPACVDMKVFNPSYKKDTTLISELKLQNKIVCVYAGKFGGIYLKEEIFEFYKACYQIWKDDFVALILTNHSFIEIDALILKTGLPKSIFRIFFVPHAQVHKYIGLGDFAITPVKPVNTKRYCTPIKDGEYWAMGLPVVITKNISDDSEIIKKNNIGSVLEDLNKNAYLRSAEEIKELLNADVNKKLSIGIRAVAEKYRNFEIAKHVYQTIYATNNGSGNDN